MTTDKDLVTNKYSLMFGDCLERMKEIPDGSVDMILTDPPYGTTACKWDTIIDLDKMWKQLERVVKQNGAIILTASQPFTSALIMSNPKLFKYEWIWSKDKPNNFALANKMPMKYHENVCVFYKKQPIYNKKMQPREGSGRKRCAYVVDNSNHKSNHYTFTDKPKLYNADQKNPSSIQYFSTGRRQDLQHPTQKPVSLMEYFITTYTNENQTVLDFTMGSGTTGVACLNTNRKFIGIEMDETYYDLAKNRIEKAEKENT